MSKQRIQRVVIVGGGAAGWLVANILASRYRSSGVQVVLVESDDIPTLGVGEGTWPSMRSTLKKIGVSETEFIKRCNASFKQGSKFIDWKEGAGECYYHPFELPAVTAVDDLWTAGDEKQRAFADAVCPSVRLDKQSQAPKLASTPEFAGVVNYGYHLDANGFGALLRENAEEKHGVRRVVGTVSGVHTDQNNFIESIQLSSGEHISGDLFVDCSGFASVLMKGHYQTPVVDHRSVLFNDSAMAVQVPYLSDDAPIQSYTLSTAQKYGWVWDIGLANRRGVGYTYSSSHASDDCVQQTLNDYIGAISSKAVAEGLTYRKIRFQPGHLERFWTKNCVAIGVSAGFIEPLEASALVMIELAATMLADCFPPTYEAMPMLEKKYNERFAQHWKQIIEFLKLHYILSERQDSQYWQDNRDQSSIPDALWDKLEYWRYFPASRYDDTALQDLFPAASYQYVLYGMGHFPEVRAGLHKSANNGVLQQLQDAERKAGQLVSGLPSNRVLLSALQGA